MFWCTSMVCSFQIRKGKAMDNYSAPPPSLSAGTQVWAYFRDSGGSSQEQSIDQQEHEVKEYCKRNHLVLMKSFRDVARSGGSAVGRHEFISMIDLSQDKATRPGAILIWNFARFARDYNDFVFYKATLNKRGVIVHSLTDQIPHDDFAGKIVETIISLANEEKRRQTSKDVKRALKSLVTKGYAPGVPPRGYVAIKVAIGEKRDGTPRVVSKWEPDPVLSEYVKVAWQLRAEGKSYREITQATHGKLYTSANSWHSFFKNKAYLGIGKSGSLEVPDHHEPLITWELWENIQKRFEDHPLHKLGGHLNHPRRVGHPSLLSGFTYCIECGAMVTYSADVGKQPWPYYICGKRGRHGAGACKSKRVGAHNAETAIMAFVVNKILTPGYLSNVIAETKKQLDSTDMIERQIKAEQRRLEDLEIAIQRNLNTIEKTGSPAAQDRLAIREAERAQVKSKIDQLSTDLETAQMEITPEAMDIILAAWREQLSRLQESGSIRDIKSGLLKYVTRIELGYNTARIFYTYPIKDILSPRNTLPLCGGTVSIRGVKIIVVEWSK